MSKQDGQQRTDRVLLDGDRSDHNGDGRRSARLNMRLTPESLQLLREASRLQAQDVTSFVLGAAIDHARRVLIAHRQAQGGPGREPSRAR